MKLNWKWILGLVLILALIALPLGWQFFMPYGGGYGMMRNYRYGMPMTLAPGASAGVGGYGMTPFHGALAPFGMWFMWL
ncbi:MAG TPA: hypothetical protein VMJ90_01005, partial [Anaerolineales bacterium]|nr:hypothetical protein [Anaerolineales bacterium]